MKKVALFLIAFIFGIANAGTLVNPSSGGTPAGSNGQFQINNSGAFGGVSPTGSGNVVLATGPRISKRVTSLSSSSTNPTFTIAGDSTDIVNISATGSTGTVTFAAPSPSTPNDGDQILIRITCTNAQTFSWNAIFTASTSLALPTAPTGGGKMDEVLFTYNSTATKWQLQATNFGF